MQTFEEMGIRYIQRIEKEGSDEEIAHIVFSKSNLRRVQKNKDVVIICTAERGEGKTTFSMNSGLILAALPNFEPYHKLPKMRFDWDSVITEYDQKTQKRLTTEEHTIFNCDEIIDIAFSADAIQRKTRFFSKVFSKTRKLNNIYFLNIPFFKRITSFFRDIGHIWVHIVFQQQNETREDSYAYAYVFTKSKDPTLDDPWGLDVLSKVKTYGRKATLRKLRGHPGFICEIKFRPMYQDLEDKYELMSKKALKDTDYGEAESIKNIA